MGSKEYFLGPLKVLLWSVKVSNLMLECSILMIFMCGCGMWVWCVPDLLFQKLEAMSALHIACNGEMTTVGNERHI